MIKTNWIFPQHVYFYKLHIVLYQYLTHSTYSKMKIYRTYSVQFSCSLVSDSLRPLGLQHARLPCPSLSPRICSHSCPLSQWCHLTISSSVPTFSSCPQYFSASESFPMSWSSEKESPEIFQFMSKNVLCFLLGILWLLVLHVCLDGRESLWVHLVWDPLYFLYLDVFGFVKFSAII